MFKRASVFFFLLVLIVSATAQSGPVSQPTVWATKPDAAAFEKIVNDRLAEGQESIDKIVAVKTTTKGQFQNVPEEAVGIKSAKVVSK